MKKETSLLIVFIVTFVFLNLIGYCFDIEILKTMITKAEGVDFCFVPLLSSLMMSILAGLIIKEK